MTDTPKIDNEAALAALIVHALVGKLAHDLVGPLGTQIGYLDLLSRSARDEEEQGYLERATRQSKKLLTLIGAWRDGLSDASAPFRSPIRSTELANIIGIDVNAQTEEPAPASLAHAARLCLKWWKEQHKSGTPKVTLKAEDEQAQIALDLPGVNELSVAETWEPREPTDPRAWDLYLARLLVGRAHGDIQSESNNEGCCLTLRVPL